MLLREWQSVCTAIAAGQNHLLIRKGGIAEGRAGFELKQSFFGLLPTLFHQVKNAAPDARTPEPPMVVSLICQLVDAFVVPSLTDLKPFAPFHAYAADQLDARQNYKTERPLHLLVIRPFRLKQPMTIAPGAIAPSCKSWVELPLNGGMGGIEPIGELAKREATFDSIRCAIQSLPNVRRLEA